MRVTQVKGSKKREDGSPSHVLRGLDFSKLSGRSLALALCAAWAFWLSAARSDEGSPVPATSERRTVVVLGDSLAAGYGLDVSESYPALLQKKVDEAGLKFSVVNAGVSGDTSAGGSRRIGWLLQRRIDVLVLALGGNDGLRGIPVSVTRTNLQLILDRTRQRYPRAELIIAGMQMPPSMGADYTAGFARIFPELASTNQCALIPFLLEGVGGKPALNQPDLIHPTADGQRIVADNVWKVLRPVLQRMSAPPAPPTR